MLSLGAESLREEVDRWRALVNHLPALVAYWDRDQRNVVANDAYLEWFGLTPRQVRGMHLAEVLGPAVYAANLPHVQAALAGEHQRFDRTLVTAAGETRHTQADYIPHVTDAGVQGFYVLVADITDKVEAERDLLAAQALARMGSYTYDPTTETLKLSPELRKLLGLEPGGPGPTVEDYLAAVHPDDQDLVATVRAQARQGQEYETSYRIVRPDGAVRHVHSRTSQVLGPDGRVLLLRGVMQDETETQRLADELATTNRLLTDLIGMLGHDLQQPVAVTNGYLEHLDDEWEETPEEVRRALVGRARRSGKRVEGLLGDILSMVSVETSQLLVRPEPVDVAAVAHEVAAQIGLELTCRTSSTGTAASSTAYTDPLHLARILENLLRNAARYGRPPYEVELTTEGRDLVLSVRDHGDGVPADFRPHLFERFARAGTGVAAQLSGTGFGLYLVRELARANHGDVRHHVPADGPGAVFELRLPTAPAPAEPG